MNKLTKSIVSFALIIVFSVVLVGSVSAQIGDVPNPGLGDADVEDFTLSIINTILGLLGLIALVIILLGGFKWMTSGGNEEKVGEAKKLMGAGIVGLVIILASYAIATYVINQLTTATGV